MSVFSDIASRPPFRADGRVVARREVRVGKLYQPGQDIPPGALDGRQLAVLWDQLLIDTLPPAPRQQNQRR